MTPRRYPIARQRHLGDYLDQLQAAGHLSWRWSYDNATSTAEYWITVPPATVPTKHGTRQAEAVATSFADQLNHAWLPVPHPGGETQLAATAAKMTERRQQGRE